MLSLPQLILHHLGPEFADQAEFLEEVLADYPAEPLLDAIWAVLRAPDKVITSQAAVLIIRAPKRPPGAPTMILLDLVTHRLSVNAENLQLGRIEWAGGKLVFHRRK